MTPPLQRLLNFPIPQVQQELCFEDAAFYALSVGFGQDPLNRAELAYIDPTADIVAVPSMALVLAYPGFWLGLPDIGLDADKIVHAQQEVVLHSTLPSSGRFSSRTRITDVFDRGPENGSVLHSERDLVRSADESVVATLRQVHFLRGDHFPESPPMSTARRDSAPSTAPSSCLELQTRPEQALFYRLNGDMNPLHMDPAVAQRAGFPRPILHGMCTFGIVTRAVIAAHCGYQAQLIESLSMRFRAPVYPGESLRVEIWPSGAIRVHAVERNVLVVDGGAVCVRHAPS